MVKFDQFNWCASLPRKGLARVQYKFKLPEFADFQTNSTMGETELCKKVWFQERIEDFQKLIDQDFAWDPTLDRLPAALR